MEQQHLSTTAQPTPEPGVSARPYACLSLGQADAILMRISCAKDLNYLMATADLMATAASAPDFDAGDTFFTVTELIADMLNEISDMITRKGGLSHD